MHSVLSLDPAMKEQKYKPGPAQYKPDFYYSSQKKKDPSVRFGSETRQDLGFEKRKLFQKDPGSYNPNMSTRIKASEWRFGTEERPGLVPKGLERNPGPNAYTAQTFINEGPAHSLHAKTDLVDQVKKKNIPGPGTYNLQDSPNLNHKK